MPASISVGQGIKRVKRPKPVKIPVDPATTPVSEISQAAADLGDWTTVPDVAGMLNKPEAYRLMAQEALILDLSKAEELKKYNEILTQAGSAKANILILEKDVKFVEELQSWKVLITIQHVQFKKLFKKGHTPEKFEEQQELLKSI